MDNLTILTDNIITEKHGKRSITCFALPITLDTETSNITIYPEAPEIVPFFPLSDALRGRILAPITDYGEMYDSKQINAVLRQCGVLVKDGGATLEELYTDIQYLCPGCITPVDILNNIIRVFSEELENKKQLRELSDLPPDHYGWIYQWAICIDASAGKRLTGRTVLELIKALKIINRDLEKLSFHYGRDVIAKIYVHNLSYDYTYLFQFL